MSPTKSDRIQEMKARHAMELAHLETEEKILAALDPSLRSKSPRIFLHNKPLYGIEGTIKFGRGLYPETWKPDFAFLVEAIGALPAVSMVQVKDGMFTSFRPAPHVESLPESKKERWQSEVNISPLTFEFEGVTSVGLKAEWVTKIAGRLMEVQVELGYPPRAFGLYEARRVRRGDTYVYEPAKFIPGPQMHAIQTNDGETIAQLEQPVRWASGGRAGKLLGDGVFPYLTQPTFQRPFSTRPVKLGFLVPTFYTGTGLHPALRARFGQPALFFFRTCPSAPRIPDSHTHQRPMLLIGVAYVRSMRPVSSPLSFVTTDMFCIVLVPIRYMTKSRFPQHSRLFQGIDKYV